MEKARKKVLIVSYYWPPAGGVAVQRWYKFVSYLRDFGYEPIVFTVADGEFPVYDHSKDDLSDEIEVIREPIMEPYKFYKKFTGKKKDTKIKQETFAEKGAKEGLAIWVRGNFFIPDARKFWIKRSYRRIADYLQSHSIDAIITNGTPHSCHIIGLKIKRKFNIPWLADFRDPWTQVDYFDQLKLTKWAERKHLRLEYNVLEAADVVTTVSWTWEKDFKQLGAKKTATITNGYDPVDFQYIEHKPTEDFVLTHLGTLSKYRFHQEFWEILASEIRTDTELEKQLKIQLVGNVDSLFFSFFEESGLSDYVEHIPHVDHYEALSLAAGSDVLLLMLGDKTKSEGRIPAKIFEYMAMSKPVLAYGQSPSDVEKIIRDAAAGQFVAFDDLDQLRRSIRQLFVDFREGKAISPQELEKYHRKNLTSELARILNTITK